MDVWNKCREWKTGGLDSVVATVIRGTPGSPGRSGFKMAICADGSTFGTVGGGAAEFKTTEAAERIFETHENIVLELDLNRIGMACDGSMTLFLEYIASERRFIVFGAGHLGQAFIPVIESIGYSVTVFDNRPQHLSLADETKGRRVVIGDYADISILKQEIVHSGRILLSTYGHSQDELLLRQLIAMNCGYEYLGMVGSAKKIGKILQSLNADGIRPPENFYAPVGLAVGGDTVSEIAVSIAAEVLAVRNNKPSIHMRDEFKTE